MLNPEQKGARFVLIFYGFAFIAAGIIMNPLMIELYVSSNDRIESGMMRNAVFIMEVFLCGFGVFLIFLGIQKKFPQKLLRLLRNLRITIISLLLTGVAIEILVRLFFPFERKVLLKHLQADELTGWRGIPSAQFQYETHESKHEFETNDGGFRGRFSKEEKEEKHATGGNGAVAFFGDSFTFGCEVIEDSLFSSVFEKLGALWSRKVYNFGVSGFSPIQELLLYRSMPELQADTVVLMLYVGNDFLEIGQSGDPFFVFRRPGTEFSGEEIRVEPVLYSPTEIRRQNLSCYLPESEMLNYFKFDRNPFGTVRIRNDEEFLEVALPGKKSELLIGMAKILREFHQVAYERRQFVLTVLIPSNDQLNQGIANEQFEWTDRMDLIFFDDFFRSVECEGYHFHNLAPDLLEEIKKGKRLFFEENRHFTNSGHKAAAESIQKFARALQDERKEGSIHDRFLGFADRNELTRHP